MVSQRQKEARSRARAKQAERWERNRARRGMLTTEQAAERFRDLLLASGAFTVGRVFVEDAPCGHMPNAGTTDWVLHVAHRSDGTTSCSFSSVRRYEIPGLGVGREQGHWRLGGNPSWEAALIDARKGIARLVERGVL